MSKEEFLSSGLIELYTLQLTSLEETQKVEKMMEKFPEIRSMIYELESSLEKYILAQEIQLPPDLKNEAISKLNKKNN